MVRSIIDKRLVNAINFAEEFADGMHAKKQLKRVWETYRGGWSPIPVSCLLETDSQGLREAAEQFARESGGWHTEQISLEARGHPAHVARVVERNHLLRCVFGNPFRPVVFDPKWWSETATALAAGIYEERAFDRLPILADALEEAGCDHADVLAHCRGSGPHARGCWVVDLVLGKE